LLGTLSGAARQVRGAADAGRAALHAQSLMAQLGVGEALKPGTTNGELEDGRYRWSVDIQRWQDPCAIGGCVARSGCAQLVEVRLGIEWGDGGPRQRLQLRTLRLLPPSAETSL
jgi:general secretion pathway protein I